MLKFTAQLSQEFRRASSLSSLKAYHIARQKSQNHNNLEQYPQYHKRTNTYNHHHSCKKSKIYDNYIQQPMHHHCNMNRTISQFNQPKYNYMVDSPSYQPQKFVNNYRNCVTPQRVRCQNHNLVKKQGNRSTVPQKFYSNQPQQRNKSQIIVKQPFNTLSQLKINQIAVDNYTSLKGQDKHFQYDSGGKSNENTVRKIANINQQRTNAAAKMRISSINNLQNIQKKIQATLGHHNNLRI